MCLCCPSLRPSHTLELQLISIWNANKFRSVAPPLLFTITHTHTHPHTDECVSSRHHPAPSLLYPGADFCACRWGFNEQQGQRRAIYSMHSLIRDINNLDQDWTLNLELWALEKFISICQCLHLLSVRLIVPLGQWDESSHSAYAIFPPSILWEQGKSLLSLSLTCLYIMGYESLWLRDRIMTDLHPIYRAFCF